MVEINVSVEELRKRKLFVAIPCYGGNMAGITARSTNDLSAMCMHYGIELRYYYLFNESLVTRARNYCADEFLRSDATHFMFIDSDIGFTANDVLTMLALQSEESAYDILCAPYPKKCISWEKIKVAVDKGFADKDPNMLEKFVGDYVFNPANGSGTIQISEPAEVLESGTGFMMIKRTAFQTFAKEYPHLTYRPDHVRTAAFDGSREIHAFFDAVIDNKHAHIYKELQEFLTQHPKATHEEILEFVNNPKSSAFGSDYSNRYLSEDYMFCQWARKVGLKVWLCPWISLTHFGTYAFGGSLADLAQLGVSATADIATLGSRK